MAKQIQEFYRIKERLEREKYLGEEPTELQELVLYWVYVGVQFVILYDRFGSHCIPEPKDSAATLRDKAIYALLQPYWTKLIYYVHGVSERLYNDLCNRVEAHVGGDLSHPMVLLLEKVSLHQELHCRHIKTDPGASRTRADVVVDTYNAVTGELYDAENPVHKSWVELIFNPLPSDYKHTDIDPEEGGDDHKTQIELMKLDGTYHVPDPFCMVVTKDWGEAIQFVHSLCHFQDYVVTIIWGAMSDEDRKMVRTASSWEAGWALLLTPEFANVPIGRLKGGKKKIPHVVSNLIALRELFKKIVTFTKV